MGRPSLFLSVALAASAARVADAATPQVEVAGAIAEPGPTPEEEHLTPEPGILTAPAYGEAYERAVRAVFTRGYAPDVVLRVVCLPSRSVEWMVGVRRVDGALEVFELTPRTPVWRTEGGIPAPARPEDVEVVERVAPLAPDAADLVARAWARMIEQARFDHLAPADLAFAEQHIDGDTYHFAVAGPALVAGATTWSPHPDSRSGRLVDLARLLSALARATQGEREALEARIATAAEALIAP